MTFVQEIFAWPVLEDTIFTEGVLSFVVALTTDEKLLVWSAKEAVYKLFSEDKLMFFDMQTLEILPRKDADGQQTGLLRMENLKRNIVVDVLYEFTDDYVLTYTILPA